jgi:hypothetical protein
MSPRRRTRRRRGCSAGVVLLFAAAVVVLVLHRFIGTFAAGLVAGMLLGAGAVLRAARPRLSLRVSTRGTRARELRRRRV